MKNPELRGIGTVFRYTVQQHYKTPSTVIFLLILFVLAIASMPAMLLLSGHEKEVTETAITTLYLRNETGFPLNTEALRADSRYAAVTVAETAEDDSKLSARVLNEKTAAASILAMQPEKQQFTLRTLYGERGDVSNADAETLNHVLQDALHQSLLESMSITEAQAMTVRSSAVSQVAKVTEFNHETEETDTETHVFLNIGYCYLLMIICAISIAHVTQACIEEKSSKLVESLLVSVTPTALLTGKILAVAVFVFTGFGLLGLGLFLSYQIAGNLGGFSFLIPMIEQFTELRISALHFTLPTLLLLVLCIVIAFLMCAGLSGISGSCCSKTEDLQSASFLNMFFLLGGYLGGAFAPMFESDAVNLFCSLFPVTSVFTAFPNYTCGKIGLPVLVLALIIQAATAVLLVRTAGRVYKMMLLYRGSVPKPAQIIKMLKEERASEQAAKAAAGKEAPHGK